MGVETDAERLTRLVDFGQSITFSPGDTYPNRNDKTAEITAIFDSGYFEITGEETGTDSKTPTITARDIDTADAARNSMVEIGADVYKVVGVERDGTGMTELILEGPK